MLTTARVPYMRLATAVAIVCALFCGAITTAGHAYAQDSLVAGSITESSGQQALEADTTEYADIAKVKLNKKSVKLKNDGTFAFAATLVPSVAGKKVEDETVTWSISKPGIASITQDGVVQGKKAGTAVVTAKASNGKKATAEVKVSIDKSKMAKAIPVLTYHRIASDAAKSRVYSGTNLTISVTKFDQQMKWLKSHGYRTISTTEFKDWRLNGAFLPKKSVLITMDDGFYEVYHIALPILKKYGFKATSFIVGSKTGEKTEAYNPLSRSDHFVGWDVIKEVRENYPYLEFQSHTFDMHHKNASGNGVATSYSRKIIDRDFKRNEKFGFTCIAYPYGHTSKNLLASVRENKSMEIGFGYKMNKPATHDSPRYNIPRFKVYGDRGLNDFASIASTAR